MTLQIGGGLLAGAALLGGGYLAWQHHQKKTEEQVSSHRIITTFPANLPSLKKQELTWGAQSWQTDAYARTEEFRNHGPRGPTSWVLVEGREKIPRSALEAGKDKDGNSIYIARAFFEGGTRTFDGPDFFFPSVFHLFIEIGKASRGFKEGAAIGYAGSVVEVRETIFHTLRFWARSLTENSSSISLKFLSAIPEVYNGCGSAPS
jgi:hypothetical protein